MDVKAISSQQVSIEMNAQSTTKLSQEQLNNQVLQKDRVKVEEQKNKDKNLSPQLLEQVVEDLKKKLSMLNTQLQIKIDKDTDMVVVKVIDKTTKKVIRQIPPEYVLKIAKYLDEITGLLYNEKV